MSAEIVLKVLNSYPEPKGTELWLALVMSAVARADGSQICATVGTLAKRLQLSDRTIQHHLRRMEKSNWLIKANAGDGRNGQPTRYRISPPWINGTPSIKDILTNCAAAAGTKPAIEVGAKSRKKTAARRSKKNISPTGANTANCSKNEQDFFHPQYRVYSIYKLNEEGIKTLVPAKALGPGWKLPARFGNWALETFPDWTRELVLRFAENFKRYWLPTGKAREDWFATWCKFCRQEADYLKRNPHLFPVAAPPSSQVATATARGESGDIRAYPGESAESFRRRKQATADAHAVSAPALQPISSSPATIAGQKSAPEPTRTPERIALIRESLARAREAAMQGVARHKERMTAGMQTAMPPQHPIARRRVSDLPEAAQPCAENPSPMSTIALYGPTVAQTAAVTDASADKAVAQAQPAPVKHAQRQQPSLRVDAIRKSGYGQIRKIHSALRQRRIVIAHARASPPTSGSRRVSRTGIQCGFSYPPWLGASGKPSVRPRYLLPDATAQWR